MKIEVALRADAVIARYAAINPNTGAAPSDEVIENYHKWAREVSPLVLAGMLENILVETWGPEQDDGYLRGRIKSFSEQVMAACVIEKYPREEFFLAAVHAHRVMLSNRAKKKGGFFGKSLLDQPTGKNP